MAIAGHGGASMVWIGDVHQLQPVQGTAVYTPLQALKKGAAQDGRLLWTGELWTRGNSLGVIMKHPIECKGSW